MRTAFIIIGSMFFCGIIGAFLFGFMAPMAAMDTQDTRAEKHSALRHLQASRNAYQNDMRAWTDSLFGRLYYSTSALKARKAVVDSAILQRRIDSIKADRSATTFPFKPNPVRGLKVTAVRTAKGIEYRLEAKTK